MPGEEPPPGLGLAARDALEPEDEGPAHLRRGLKLWKWTDPWREAAVRSLPGREPSSRRRAPLSARALGER